MDWRKLPGSKPDWPVFGYYSGGVIFGTVTKSNVAKTLKGQLPRTAWIAHCSLPPLRLEKTKCLHEEEARAIVETRVQEWLELANLKEK